MSSARVRALTANVLLGLLCPIAWSLVFLAVVQLVGPPEWVAPGVTLVALLAISWISSGMAGWLCGRFVKDSGGGAGVFLANSSGWLSLIWVAPPLVGTWGRPDSAEVMTYFAIAIFVSVIGLFIARAAMKAAANREVQ